MRFVQYVAPDTSYPLSNRMTNLLKAGTAAAQCISRLVPNQHILLIGIGTSGALAMTAIAQGLEAVGRTPHGILLHKDSEKTHRYAHGSPPADDRLSSPAVFVVDDLMSSGKTISEVCKALPDVYYYNERGEDIGLGNSRITGLLFLDVGNGPEVFRRCQDFYDVTTEFDFLITRVARECDVTFPTQTTSEETKEGSLSCKKRATSAQKEREISKYTVSAVTSRGLTDMFGILRR